HGVENEAYKFSVTTSTQNDDAALVKLQSEPIDISGREDLEMNFDVMATGQLEGSGAWTDYFQVIAIVDGESHELHQIVGNHPDGNDVMHSITLSDIPQGDELVISFEAKTTNTAEAFTID
ncbi:hypothetical protein MLD52_23425, partial [Puniceicoccaceae bacterium K14]|nr:hypothetical protein [Puniceicoccaceae bacterium K14]MCH6259527.1 hypothetical protein [Puniceicoccaceae bacterium K14]